MRVLIVESKAELGKLWQRHLERQGGRVHRVASEEAAIDFLQTESVDVIVLDLVLPGGNPLAIADFASYRQPDARVIFVTNTSFFSDGSIFRHCPNACAFVQSESPPEDIAAMVAHYGGADRKHLGETA